MSRIRALCLGTNAAVGGVQGGMYRGRKSGCPVCGRQVGMRRGRAGRLYPHAAKEPAARSRWQCPKCGSEDCQISLPAWFRESPERVLSYVEPDTEANLVALSWRCLACGENGPAEPEEVEKKENRDDTRRE